MFSQKVSRAFLLIFASLTILFFTRGAWAQEAEATKTDGQVEYDFAEMMMTQTPHAIREMGSGIAENFPVIIALAVSIAVVFSFLTNMGEQDGKNLMTDMFKIATGAFLLSMVWGSNSWYSRSISPALDGLSHPDKGKYMHVDLYYISQSLSKKLGTLIFPELDDGALDEFTKNVSVKTDVIIFSTNCKTTECVEKLKVYYATKKSCPKDMAELMGADYKEPEADSTGWSASAVFSYLAAKVTGFLQVPVLIGFGFFIFKIIMQIFLFFNALLLTIIAQITLIIFMFTSITVLFPKLFGTFRSSLVTIAAISLFNFVILFINGITAIMLKNIDLGLAQVISGMSMGDSMSNVIVESATMTIAVLVIHIAAIKMVPTIATAIASGNISGLMNLAQSISGAAAAMAITGASALGSLIPFVGGGVSLAGASIANKLKERFGAKPGGSGPPSGGGGARSSFAGPVDGPKTQLANQAQPAESIEIQESFKDSSGDLFRVQPKPEFANFGQPGSLSQDLTPVEGATLQRKSNSDGDEGLNSSGGGIYRPENSEIDESGQYLFPGVINGGLDLKEKFNSSSTAQRKSAPKSSGDTQASSVDKNSDNQTSNSLSENANKGKILSKRDRTKSDLDLERDRVINSTKEKVGFGDLFRSSNIMGASKQIFSGAIRGSVGFAVESAKAGLLNKYDGITDPLAKAQGGIKEATSFRLKSEREIALDGFELNKEKFNKLLSAGFSESEALNKIFRSEESSGVNDSLSSVDSNDKSASTKKGVLSRQRSKKA